GPAMRRLTFTILAVSTVITALVPVSPARAASTITLFGSGNGHGIGLSQWGAFGLAQDGWSHGDILTHFYQGTRVSSTAALPRLAGVQHLRLRDPVQGTAHPGHPVRAVSARGRGGAERLADAGAESAGGGVPDVRRLRHRALRSAGRVRLRTRRRPERPDLRRM